MLVRTGNAAILYFTVSDTYIGKTVSVLAAGSVLDHYITVSEEWERGVWRLRVC